MHSLNINIHQINNQLER